MKDTVYTTGTSTMTIEVDSQSGKTALLSVDLQLELSPKLDETIYYNPDGKANQEGIQALTNTFIYGLAANVNYGHQSGQWDKEQHLAYIFMEIKRGIDELEKI